MSFEGSGLLHHMVVGGLFFSAERLLAGAYSAWAQSWPHVSGVIRVLGRGVTIMLLVIQQGSNTNICLFSTGGRDAAEFRQGGGMCPWGTARVADYG